MLKIMIFKESSEEIFRDRKKIVVQTKMNDEKNEETSQILKNEIYKIDKKNSIVFYYNLVG